LFVSKPIHLLEFILLTLRPVSYIEGQNRSSVVS